MCIITSEILHAEKGNIMKLSNGATNHWRSQKHPTRSGLKQRIVHACTGLTRNWATTRKHLNILKIMWCWMTVSRRMS